MTTDVVVVGAGNAGLVAALSAREAGADVIVLEAAPYDQRGGNSSFSGGIFRTAHDGLETIEPLLCEEGRHWLPKVSVASYPSASFRADWSKVSVGLPNPELMDTVIHGSYDTLVWMQGHGVNWELCTGKLFDESKLGEKDMFAIAPGSAVRARHEGVGLMKDLFGAAERAGVDIWYEAPAAGLLTRGSRVYGVRVRPGGNFVEVHGSVVLACGGFEANPEKRLRYLGSGWDLVKVRGTRFNMGSMLEKALMAGAQPAGHWEGCHAAPIDAAAPPVGDIKMTDKYSRYSYPYAIMVNHHGQRFVDEAEDHVWLTYAKTGSAIRAQPRNLAFQIFDQKTVHLLEPRYSTGTPVVAEDLSALARELGVPADALAETVGTYNAAVADDALERFEPLEVDGVSAEPGGQPRKSNWALPLDSPPYVAYPCSCGITFTYGGLKIDPDARVLDTEGKPMEGLYATGEIIGEFFYYNYAAGTGLTRGAVFGRIAGRGAALHAGSGNAREVAPKVLR